MKIGVFICHCGFNIAGVLDISKILEHFKKNEQKGLDKKEIFIIDNDYFCSDSGLKKLSETIDEEKIDRVVIAACTFKMHGELFKRNIEKAGIQT